jgi:hypothetical protein
MRQRAADHATAWKPEPHPTLGNAVVVGDTAKRQVFHCKRCGATHVLLNVTLLRLLLEAIAAESRTVSLNGSERPESARVSRVSPAAPLPADAARFHTCTIWCSGGEHVERVGPLAPWSDDEIRAKCESCGLEITRIEPTPEYMSLPGDPPGRLIWFRPLAAVGG